MMVLALVLGNSAAGQSQSLPEGFVYLENIIPDIRVEVRYCSTDNFMGQPVDGYRQPCIILTRQAAQALAAVQAELRAQGLGLKVFDAYRPQRAVNHFVYWSQQAHDTLKKAEYYPDIPKKELFNRGYIAAHSSHSGGSTVDLTLIDLNTGQELDMGTPYDFFSPLSWPSSMEVSPEARQNRLQLQRLMEWHGFRHLKTEWWHFTLREEPFPASYFDFVVE